MEADAAVIASVCWQRGQGNFELAANFGYSSRGSVDPRESLRKRRISKLPLIAHKVLPADRSNDCRCALVETLVAGVVRFFEKVEENEKNEEIFAISDKNMLNELSV